MDDHTKIGELAHVFKNEKSACLFPDIKLDASKIKIKKGSTGKQMLGNWEVQSIAKSVH